MESPEMILKSARVTTHEAVRGSHPRAAEIVVLLIKISFWNPNLIEVLKD